MLASFAFSACAAVDKTGQEGTPGEEGIMPDLLTKGGGGATFGPDQEYGGATFGPDQEFSPPSGGGSSLPPSKLPPVGGSTCAVATVPWDKCTLIQEDHRYVVDLFNDAAMYAPLVFMPNQCGEPMPQDRTRHHSTCSPGPFAEPTCIDDGAGTTTIFFEGEVQASISSCTEGYSCVAGVLESTPIQVSCDSPYVEFEFKAEGGSDWYEAVVGLYLINGSRPLDVFLVDSQTYRGDQMTDFVTQRFTGMGEGTYLVRFFGASYDRSGGAALGSSMQVKRMKGTFSKLVLHGDPVLKKANGEERGARFHLKPGHLTPLLMWTSPTGEKMSLEGSTFEDDGRIEDTTHEWLNQLILKADGNIVVNATAGSSQFGTIHVAVDQKPLLLAPDMGQTHTVRSATKSVELKISKLQNKLEKNKERFMIGDKHAEKLAISAAPLQMEIYSSKAGKFELNKHRQIKYMHLNLRLLGALPSGATGPLAELAGTAPLSAETQSLITLTRARHDAAGV